MNNSNEATQGYNPTAMFSQLLNSSNMGTVKAPKWLVKGMVEQNKVSCVFGPSGSFKSFVMLDMGLSIASGKDFHGRPTEQGSVLYVCGEGKEGINKRIKAWEQENNNNESVNNFFVTPTPIALNTAIGMDMMNAYLDGIKEATGAYPVKIIIDTLDRNFEGDENSSQAMSGFVTALTNIRIKTEASVAVVHHTGKGNSDTARGSNVLRSGMDTEIKIFKDDNANVIIENTKMKDEKDGGSITMRYKVVKVGHDEKYNEEITSVVLYTNIKAEKIKKRIEQLESEIDEIKVPFKNQRVVLAEALMLSDDENQVSTETLVQHMVSLGKTRKQTREALNGLSSKGHLVFDKDMISNLPSRQAKII